MSIDSTRTWVDRASRIADYARTTGMSLELLGAGVVEDADCRDIRWTALSIRGEQSYWRSAGLRVTGRRTTPTFRRCDFSGLQTRGLQAYARFEDCVFRDVSVKISTGTAALDIVGCEFSGEWDGNISARDGRRKITGNDFRTLRGVTFLDGVDRQKNIFDHGGSQLILDRQGSLIPAVREVERANAAFGMLARSLRQEGPLRLGSSQEWALLERANFEASQWEALRENLAP